MKFMFFDVFKLAKNEIHVFWGFFNTSRQIELKLRRMVYDAHDNDEEPSTFLHFFSNNWQLGFVDMTILNNVSHWSVCSKCLSTLQEVEEIWENIWIWRKMCDFSLPACFSILIFFFVSNYFHDIFGSPIEPFFFFLIFPYFEGNCIFCMRNWLFWNSFQLLIPK